MRLRRMPAATKNAPPPEREPFRRASPSSVNVFFGRRLPERAAGALHQVALDEDVDVAVENAVDVADLLLRPVILHHLVRMQDVAADLAAEPDLLLDAADLRQLRLVLFHLDVIEARLEHAHRRVAIAVLRSLVLARDDEAGRQVREADCRVGGVDGLPAGAARSEGVDAELLVVDDELGALRQLGPDI